jgi:hypothetical protein
MLEALLNKGFTESTSMKRGTDQRFREIYAKKPLIRGLRRCVFMSSLEESSRTRSEEFCCGGSLETYQGFVHEGIADRSLGRVNGRGTEGGQGVVGCSRRNGARVDSQEGREGVHAAGITEGGRTRRAGQEKALRQGSIHGLRQMICGEAGLGAPQGAPAEEAEGCRAVSETFLKWQRPSRRKSERCFPFNVVVDDVGVAM